METPRILFTFAALTIVFYTTYLASHSSYAERRHSHPNPASPSTSAITTLSTLPTLSHQTQQCIPLPICATRAALVSAIATGKGCTFKWLSATEICMVLERFGAVAFVGDKVVGGVYEGLELLLSSGIGGTYEGGEGRRRRGFGGGECVCAENMYGRACLGHSMWDLEIAAAGEKKEEKGEKLLQPLCTRTPTSYLPLTTHPSSPSEIDAFKSLTYAHPHPWQPSPLVLSFTSPPPQSPNPSNPLNPVPNTQLTTSLLTEWRTLALNAQRNIPLLYLGPSVSTSRTGTELDRLKVFEHEIAIAAKERKFEVLSLYNLTMGMASVKVLEGGGKGKIEREEEWERRVKMVEAMVVVNWLSKLETS